MPTRRLLVLRHGESLWNAEGRWQGWQDIALTPLGEAQARSRAATLAAERLDGATLFTSDLVRAARTAEVIAEALGLDPPTPDAGFRERHGGEWECRTATEIDEGWPGMRTAWRRGELAAPPGGEADDAVLARVDDALARAVASTAPDGLTVVVTHHGVLRLLSTRAGIPVQAIIPNLGGRWFDWSATALRARDELAPLAALDADGMAVE